MDAISLLPHRLIQALQILHQQCNHLPVHLQTEPEPKGEKGTSQVSPPMSPFPQSQLSIQMNKVGAELAVYSALSGHPETRKGKLRAPELVSARLSRSLSHLPSKLPTSVVPAHDGKQGMRHLGKTCF